MSAFWQTVIPADHPNRAALEAHNGELLDLLVRRQQRRFRPFTQAGSPSASSPA
jgi:hypothetical protein